MERNVNIVDNSRAGVRSNQNLSFNWLGTTDFGVLRPFHWEELLPTDKIVHCKPTIELQMLPLASPTFGKMNIYVHYFFVPMRLIWRNALEVFSRKGANAGDNAPTVSKNQLSTWYLNISEDATLEELEQRKIQRGLFKHWTSFGLNSFFALGLNQSHPEGTLRISSLPFRAYNQVWWDFFRDPELIPDTARSAYLRTDSAGEPANATNIYVPRRRSITDVWLSSLFANNGEYSNGLLRNAYLDEDAIFADSGISPEMRKIEALQRIAERLSMSGKRQIDSFFSLYGVKPDWLKMNMCRYLGGAKQEVLVSDITSSADTTINTEAGVQNQGAALGQKAGSGYCQFEELDIQFEAEEPGILLGVLSVMPKVHFVQGIEKRWIRTKREDFFTKELEHVGQVAVAKREVASRYYGINPSKAYNGSYEDQTFAWADPYYEYKMRQDVLAGDFLYYHTSPNTDSDEDIAYMQSMGIYVDYALDRQYNAENMALDTLQCNKIFFYQGGNMWDDVDDHFHINADITCIINRPMDGYAIPTLETTQDPHKAQAPVGGDKVL